MIKHTPHLRVERLVIVESCVPASRFIRDIPLHAGLNIVLAQEQPAIAGATEVERAGHGVGKSTFTLMLRAVLGDDGVAVKTMRRHLAEHYGSGGVAAEVLAGGGRFAVFRAFGSHSFALENGTVEDLFEEGAKENALDFSTYVTALGNLACLQRLPTRTLPGTAQAIEWGHVLCWIARDQALGLREYFEWRSDDGTGLRRKVKDPPALVRLALGLLTYAGAMAEDKISSLGGELSKARDVLKAEEQRGSNVRGIVESQLRRWAGVSNSLQMIADDLFSDSVEKELRRKVSHLEVKNGEDRAEIERLDRDLEALAGEIENQKRIVQLAHALWQETVALRNKDEGSVKEYREKRDKLLTLAGTCQHVGISFDDCRHVQEQRGTIKLTTQRDAGVLSKGLDELKGREETEKAEYDRRARVLAARTAVREKKSARKVELTKAIDGRSRQLGQGDAIRETLTQWEDSHKGPETERLRAARAIVHDLEQRLEAANRDKLLAKEQVSARERDINKRFARLAEVFGASGRYVPSEEKRPFQMVDADGDAYTVLEILLGDLTCAQDGAEPGKGAHPGFLIFDCPREREMSPHLYDAFLRVVEEVGRQTPGLQIIVTTTTPPPKPLGDPPTCVLKLSRARDQDLLLKRRIENLLSRVKSLSSDSEEKA